MSRFAHCLSATQWVHLFTCSDISSLVSPPSRSIFLSSFLYFSSLSFPSPGRTWDHLPPVRQEHEQQWQLSNGFTQHRRPRHSVLVRRRRRGGGEKQVKEAETNCSPLETRRLIMQIAQWLFRLSGRSSCREVIGQLQQHIWYSNGVKSHNSI